MKSQFVLVVGRKAGKGIAAARHAVLDAEDEARSEVERLLALAETEYVTVERRFVRGEDADNPAPDGSAVDDHQGVAQESGQPPED